MQIRLFSHDFVTRSIIETQINRSESYETNPESANKSSSIDDEKHESLNTLFRTATELNEQNIVRLPTGSKKSG